MRTGFLIAATGRYIQFVPPLVVSIRQHLVGMEPCFFVFTDSIIDGDYVRIPVSHEPWPLSTMRRCCRYHASADRYGDCDYLFSLDADMLFQGPVGTEILGDVVGVLHPGFYAKPPSHFTYERRPESTACMPMGSGSRYYAGGVYGGKREKFVELIKSLSAMVESDLQRGMIAVWHDESYLNRRFFDSPPNVVLTPAYCYPGAKVIPFEKKIVALDKNHQQMRAP